MTLLNLKKVKALSRINLVFLNFLLVSNVVNVNGCSSKQKGTRASSTSNCHSMFTRAMDHFATKTPYLQKDVNSVTPEGCTPKSIWIINRHGTRFPGSKSISNMLDILPVLRDQIVSASSQNRGELCKKEVENIGSWTPHPAMSIENKTSLVEQGRIELFGIGKRFQQRFPNLFPDKFSNETFNFRSTEEQRTIDSMKEFASGIFGPENLNTVYFPEPVIGDEVLHFYEACQKWKDQVSENSEAKAEPNNFIQSPVFQNIISSVRNRIGIDRELTTSDIKLLYDSCRFETAYNPEINSPWCALFTKEEFQVLEYAEDLEDYYMDGYFFPITYEQACSPLKSIFEVFNARINNDTNSDKSSRLLTAGFGHSGTILKFYARLGLFRDTNNLTTDSYETLNHKLIRQWRNTKIGTFAANIAFTLFHCPTWQDPYQIGTLVSEEKVSMPACDGNWICSFDKFQKSFQNIVDTCDLDQICTV